MHQSDRDASSSSFTGGSNTGLRYGLTIRKKNTETPPVSAASNTLFNDEESDEDQGGSVRDHYTQRRPTRRELDIQRRALEEDPSVFEYDSVYDREVQQVRTEQSLRRSQRHQQPLHQKKSLYVEQLMKKAAERKREEQARRERKLAKMAAEERAKLGQEAGPVYVTSAYKEKLQEMEREKEEERRAMEREEREQRRIVRRGMGSFYMNLLGRNEALRGGGDGAAAATSARGDDDDGDNGSTKDSNEQVAGDIERVSERRSSWDRQGHGERSTADKRPVNRREERVRDDRYDRGRSNRMVVDKDDEHYRRRRSRRDPRYQDYDDDDDDDRGRRSDEDYYNSRNRGEYSRKKRDDDRLRRRHRDHDDHDDRQSGAKVQRRDSSERNAPPSEAHSAEPSGEGKTERDIKIEQARQRALQRIAERRQRNELAT